MNMKNYTNEKLLTRDILQVTSTQGLLLDLISRAEIKRLCIVGDAYNFLISELLALAANKGIQLRLFSNTRSDVELFSDALEITFNKNKHLNDCDIENALSCDALFISPGFEVASHRILETMHTTENNLRMLLSYDIEDRNQLTSRFTQQPPSKWKHFNLLLGTKHCLSLKNIAATPDIAIKIKDYTNAIKLRERLGFDSALQDLLAQCSASSRIIKITEFDIKQNELLAEIEDLKNAILSIEQAKTESDAYADKLMRDIREVIDDKKELEKYATSLHEKN